MGFDIGESMNKIGELKIEIQRLEAENQIDKALDLIFDTLDNWALIVKTASVEFMIQENKQKFKLKN